MPSLPSALRSHLVVLDMQSKSMRHMPDELETAVYNTSMLMEAANAFNIPVIVTEHFPVELGPTIPEIAQHIGAVKPIAKTVNSAYKDDKFKTSLQNNRPQIILTGLEAHLMVKNTALDLMARDWHVFVVEDAVISRQASNKKAALINLRVKGWCTIIDTQSVIEGWQRAIMHSIEATHHDK